MRASLVCLIFLICILAIEAKSRWKKEKTEVRDLEEALEDLRKLEITSKGNKRTGHLKETLKALTEEESDPASGNGELSPEDY